MQNSNYMNYKKKRTKKMLITISILLALILTLAITIAVSPTLQSILSWRIEVARTYINSIIHPVGNLPTPIAVSAAGQTNPSPSAGPSPSPAATITPTPSPTLAPTPTPLPAYVKLESPKWEKEDQNNCGPTSMALYLRFYGWEGNQTTVSSIIKPLREDKNVNVEELIYYVANYAGWLNATFRVGGNLDLLKTLLSNGIPVMVERAYKIDKQYWPDDDQWAGHYLLITGYDDSKQIFITQDTFTEADWPVPYNDLDDSWKAFNRVYILVYRPEQEANIRSILGVDWDMDSNRQNALAVAQEESQANPKDTFAWFNIGSNYVYFGKYEEANLAYDKAREIGLPQRMLRYQFGPFIADFHTGRTDDLLSLTDYALKKSNGRSEEAHVWRGWAFYQKGELENSAEQYRAALEDHPDYQDALYGLDFLGVNP